MWNLLRKSERYPVNLRNHFLERLNLEKPFPRILKRRNPKPRKLVIWFDSYGMPKLWNSRHPDFGINTKLGIFQSHSKKQRTKKKLFEGPVEMKKMNDHILLSFNMECYHKKNQKIWRAYCLQIRLYLQGISQLFCIFFQKKKGENLWNTLYNRVWRQ